MFAQNISQNEDFDSSWKLLYPGDASNGKGYQI